MPRVSNEVEREQSEGKNGNDLLMTWSLILAGLNGTAGGVTTVARATGGGLAVRRAAEEREARAGLQLAMRHERHPSERQQQSEHCLNGPHA
jgi:hypothetical protein